MPEDTADSRNAAAGAGPDGGTPGEGTGQAAQGGAGGGEPAASATPGGATTSSEPEVDYRQRYIDTKTAFDDSQTRLKGLETEKEKAQAQLQRASDGYGYSSVDEMMATLGDGGADDGTGAGAQAQGQPVGGYQPYGFGQTAVQAQGQAQGQPPPEDPVVMYAKQAINDVAATGDYVGASQMADFYRQRGVLPPAPGQQQARAPAQAQQGLTQEQMVTLMDQRIRAADDAGEAFEDGLENIDAEFPGFLAGTVKVGEAEIPRMRAIRKHCRDTGETNPMKALGAVDFNGLVNAKVEQRFQLKVDEARQAASGEQVPGAGFMDAPMLVGNQEKAAAAAAMGGFTTKPPTDEGTG